MSKEPDDERAGFPPVSGMREKAAGLLAYGAWMIDVAVIIEAQPERFPAAALTQWPDLARQWAQNVHRWNEVLAVCRTGPEFHRHRETLGDDAAALLGCSTEMAALLPRMEALAARVAADGR